MPTAEALDTATTGSLKNESLPHLDLLKHSKIRFLTIFFAATLDTEEQQQTLLSKNSFTKKVKSS